MATVLDYLHQEGQAPFDQLPLTTLDILIINELAYLPYHLVKSDWTLGESVSLTDLISGLDLGQPPVFDFLVTPKRVALLRGVLASPRFAGLRLSGYVNDVDQEAERQFAAMVFELEAISHRQLVFRGTDDSLIGWKEDFNMSYQPVIPAQEAALTYLETYLTQNGQPLVVTGHSKGGNLALYASSYLPSHLQDVVRSIYIFDAPGLHDQVLTSSGYQRICERVLAYRPFESIVGVILGLGVAYQTVASQEKGLLQHDVTNWLVAGTDFVHLDGLSQLSRGLEQTFADWMAAYSGQELKLFFDTFFDLFFASGIASLNDFQQDPGKAVTNLINQLKQLDQGQKDVMKTSLSQLWRLFYQNARSLERAKQEAEWQALLERFKQSSQGLRKPKHSGK